jgi:addiction module RelE/StbE family toxin
LRAKTFVQEIRAKSYALEHFPSVGHAGRVMSTRELVVHKNYIIIYRVRAEQVQIIRVHHAAKM